MLDRFIFDDGWHSIRFASFQTIQSIFLRDPTRMNGGSEWSTHHVRDGFRWFDTRVWIPFTRWENSDIIKKIIDA